MKKKCEYEFSFAGASYFVYGQFSVFANGKMQVFLNHDTCSENQLAYTSPYLDTVWGVYTARFTANDDYEWIQFRPLYEGTGMELFLDALSPIRCLNAHEVKITGTKDTTVPASSPCVQLSAQADITTYDSLYWIKLPNDTFAYNQWNATVCPDTDAVYVVAIHDSTATCAGTWWSFDTVRVRVDESSLTSPLTPEGGTALRVFPNPAGGMVQVQVGSEIIGGEVKMYDVHGRMVKKFEVSSLPAGHAGLQFTIDISDLGKGLYIVIAEQEGKFARAKLVVE